MKDLVQQDGRTVAESWGENPAMLDGAQVAISGASGLIGRHVASILLALVDAYGLDIRVTVMGRDRARLEAAYAPWKGQSRLVFLESDVTTDSWPSDATHLIHAASPATPALFAADPVGVISANVLGTMQALKSATASRGYVLLVSTSEVYGSVPTPDESSDVVINEESLGLIDPLDVRSAYPESKRLSENLLMSTSEEFGVRGDIARISHTYGPGVSTDDNRVQVEFVRRAVRNEKIILKSDGKLRRHYTYAADSGSAIVRILTTSLERSKPEAFNVADNSSRISIRQLAEYALAAAGRPVSDLEIDIQQPAGQLWSKMRGSTFLDSKKIEALGWRPLFELHDGLRRMVEYVRDQDERVATSSEKMV